MAQREWQTFRRLLAHTRPYRGRLLLGILFGVLFGGSLGGLLYFAKSTFATFLDPEQMSMASTLILAGLLPLFAALRGAGDFLSTYFIEWTGHRVVMDLRTSAFARLQQLPLQFFAVSRTGDLMSRILSDSMQVEKAVSTVLSDLAKQPFALVSAVSFLVWLDPFLALCGLVLFPISIVPVAMFGRRVRRFAKQGQEHLSDVSSVLQETISGARVVKAFGMEAYENRRFLEQCKAVFGRSMKVTRARASIEPIITTITAFGVSAILLYAHRAHLSPDKFFAFALALVALYDPVKKLSRIHLSIQQSSAGADRIFELIDTPVTVQDKPGAQVFEGPVREVTCENVHFAYGEKPVLQGVSFAARAGQCIALVGGSGSGKTTLLSLIPRFFDATAGRVCVNGVDVRDLTLASLRKQVGIVTQETFLFNDTIANNIAYGQAGASRADIESAAKRALAHDFILEKPQGYDTVVGDRGVQLSGGQAQRLAIARAILRNPPILILDEATSALDTESERAVQAALNTLMAGRTVFAIAHRLSTVQHADLILVLGEGRIVEQGTHQELIARGGQYKYYYDLQFRDAAPAAAG